MQFENNQDIAIELLEGEGEGEEIKFSPMTKDFISDSEENK